MFTQNTTTRNDFSPTMRQNDISWLSRVYLLLNESYPEVLKKLDYDFPNQAVVAANLLQPDQENGFACKIVSESNSEFCFPLDLTAKTGHSKGDWIWINEVNIDSGDVHLLSFPVRKRVIDIPYCKKKVSAHCLFKNFLPELILALENELNI